jgi:hypothetical protein
MPHKNEYHLQKFVGHEEKFCAGRHVAEWEVK